jgi:hypothetical protein
MGQAERSLLIAAQLGRGPRVHPLSHRIHSGAGSDAFLGSLAILAVAARGALGIANTTVTKDVGLGAARQIHLSLRLSF